MYFSPREYQKVAIDWINQRDRSALFLPMGLGKSASTLASDLIYPVLIIAPLRVAQSTWPAEIEKWDQFSHLKVSVITGPAKKRLAALDVKADIYTVNYENLPWLVEHYGSKWPFKTIVADEMSRLKGFRLRQGSVQAKALARVAHSTPKFIGLTGTPSPNGVKDLWGQLWFLDRGERLGNSYSAFTDRWFRPGYDGFSIEPLPHAQKEIQERIKDLCLSIRVSDYFDIDTPIKSTVNVDLPDKARRAYNDMLKEMYVEIDEVGIEAFNAAGKTLKLLQLCNGAIYHDKGYEVVFDDKLEALDEIVKDAPSPVLVSYQFKSDLERLLKYFPEGEHLDKNPDTIRRWNKGKIPLLFAHPASAGHGLSLQDGGNVLVYFSHGWNLEHHQQIAERIGPVRQKQSGYDRPVYVYNIVARNTVEEDVIDRLENKATVQEILLRFLNRGKNMLT